MKHKKTEEMSLNSSSELRMKRIDSFVTGAIVGLILGALLTCVVLFVV